MKAGIRLCAALSTATLTALLSAGCPSDPSQTGDDAPPDAGPDPVPDAGEDCDVPFTNGVSMLAGCSAAGYVDGSRAVARFSNPVNVAYRDGTLYVADFDNDKLRAIDVATRETTTVI